MSRNGAIFIIDSQSPDNHLGARISGSLFEINLLRNFYGTQEQPFLAFAEYRPFIVEEITATLRSSGILAKDPSPDQIRNEHVHQLIPATLRFLCALQRLIEYMNYSRVLSWYYTERNIRNGGQLIGISLLEGNRQEKYDILFSFILPHPPYAKYA